MATSQVIDLTNLRDEEHQQQEENADFYDSRVILEPVITRIIDALGGVEEGEYRMGDRLEHA